MGITKLSKSGFTSASYQKYDDFLAGNTAFSPSSYESIASFTGTGSSNTITFSSIPSTYASLQIRLIGKGTYNQDSTGAILVRANGSSAADYSYHWLNGSGSSVSAGGSASQTSMWLGNSTNNGSGITNMTNATIIDILDYASTSKYKTFRSFDGNDRNGSGDVYLFSGLWQSTSAINSISLINNDGSWTSQTTIALYGIKGA